MMNERRFMMREAAMHAKAQEAIGDNNAQKYYKAEAKAEKFAEKADRAHEKHLVRESNYLKKEALQHTLAQDSMSRGDKRRALKYESKAARYHNKAGKTNIARHCPAVPGHSHHHDPYSAGAPWAGYDHDDVPMGAYGVPPLGSAPVGISAGTMPVMPNAASITGPPVAPTPIMGTMGGYGAEAYARGPGYFGGRPPRGLPPNARIGRDFDVIGWEEPEFYPADRPYGIAPEFRSVGTYW